MSTAARQHHDAYDPFALIYNRTMAEDFCRRAWPVVKRLLLSRIPRGATVLDLCCGSGQMARELSRRRYRVVGLDGSAQMLELARNNAPDASFVLADARGFSLKVTFDAVLSSFNSLAHASSTDELQAIFRNARAVLKPHGSLLFDISMEEAYTTKWRGSFGDAQDDLAFIVRPSYDTNSRLARNDVTLFQRWDSNWRRHDFAIRQRCFTFDEIRSALTDADFCSINSYDAERDLDMQGEAGRRFFLCAEPNSIDNFTREQRQ